MADAQPRTSGRRRGGGAEASARAEVLKHLKALRSGGRRSDGGGFQIKLENPIYDTVAEDEYDALVAKRREEARGFIVDDDGLGYGDEGKEEYWSKAELTLSFDESDGELKRRKRKKVEKKDPQPKKSRSSLSAAAAMMGGQRLSSMFTSSVSKKSRDDKAKGFSCDSIVHNIIAEFAPDESDRQRGRRHKRGKTKSTSGMSDIVQVNNSKVEKPSFGCPDLMRHTLLPNAVTCSEVELARVLESDGCGLDAQVICEAKRDKAYGEDLNDAKIGKCENGQALIMQSPDCPINGVVTEEKMLSGVEIEAKPAVKDIFTLNAKIKVEEDPVLSATAAAKAARNGREANYASNLEENSEVNLEKDGSLPFYMLDAYEEFYGANRGTLCLFGKVKAGKSYQSCCVVVRNMQRCVYAIPNHPLHYTDEMVKFEKDAEEGRITPTDFHKMLQDMLSGLKDEVAKRLLDLNVSNFIMTPVKRKYAFERSEIPAGENYVLKINYPFKDPPLPVDLKGESFCALLGTHCSALELFLIKRKIKGPSWLLISNFSTCSYSDSLRVSWCKSEVTVESSKDIRISTSSFEIPSVVVTAINLRTTINEKQNINEIVSASIVSCHSVKIDTPMLASKWKKPGMLTHFTVVRKLDGGIFPLGFGDEVDCRNKRAGSNVLCMERSEKALLSRLMIKLHELDSDVLIGHNISGFDLDVLLRRVQALKVESRMWSKIGRLKRSVMPKLARGRVIFGSAASPGIMSCIAGRLLCDTYLCSHDLLKEVSYSLTELAKTQLNKIRREVAPHDVPEKFQSADSLIELIEYGETDAWLSMELMFHLSVLPLTRQLTNISGNLWGKTLQGARAQRVEYLLLHSFHAKKYIVPDKIPSHVKETKLSKRKVTHVVENSNFDDADIDDGNYDIDTLDHEHKKSKKAPSYAGGLVLEPKKGLYDKYILLLDFNSLYPSIIEEYNICFTTVERSSDGFFPRLPSSKTNGVLPELLKNLVQRRRMVKSWMKTEKSPLKVQQLDIQQQALKLTANSMYGCLGCSNSRFYAKQLAELITTQGREILQSTVDLVQNNLNLEVIYGDTDSIMIYSGLDDIAKAKAMAGKVIQEVNKKYRCLVIGLDGLYKRMLLLKKKKYAAIKVQFKDGNSYEIIERKGLDIVRRDWSLLSRELGDFCLSQILSGGSCEDVVESIHSSLLKVQEEMRSGQVPLEKYIITKTLTKSPEAYPDAKNQPHVLVAQRLKQNGYSTGCSVGDTIPHIICCEQGSSSGSSTGIAQRARHPDELKREGQWLIDIDYYLSQQIHPVVSRLCASIQGTSPERLADCLGLDSSRFQNKSIEASRSDSSSSLSFGADEEERYQGCEPLVLSCPSCSCTFDCPSISKSICLSGSEKPSSSKAAESNYNFWHKLRCPKCPDEAGRISPAMIANQVKRQADKFVLMYYRGLLMCDDETCKHRTRSINLRLVGDSERGTVCPNYPYCNGRLLRKYTEADLYKQLSYLCHILDTAGFIEKVGSKSRIPMQKELAKISPTVDMAATIVQRIRDRCAYGWVKLQDFTFTI